MTADQPWTIAVRGSHGFLAFASDRRFASEAEAAAYAAERRREKPFMLFVPALARAAS